MTPTTQNDLAKRFRALHIPGNPLVLTNVWDAITARAIAALPSTTAIATASFAVAAAAGLPDDDLDLATNLRAAASIAKVAAAHDLPLTVDLQDGYGAQLDEAVRGVIRLGGVGINIEDLGREVGGLYGIEEQCARIRRAVEIAREEGVPEFVVNARSDALFAGEGLEDAVQRGKSYLLAGASNVFLWVGSSGRSWGREEIARAVEAFGGRLNVTLIRGRSGGLSVKQIGELGVARISIGPALMRWSAEQIAGEAQRILDEEAVSPV
ncbi:PEP phosphonomutase-like protein [Boeremia exigua]|uniref:PEP phosphonomutase-like protein n=1 Tax=Boeremia exigua TaxID=749465 RepID=UPI001E8E3E3F|nr:PEP phosphonomutase-like protein [Boeremia exigua]KAH6614338.1 PEP phosphonomutase-like protein [Boeremia exigua]